MAGFSLPNVDGLTSLEQVKNAVGIMTKELSWLMNNIDWKNVNELNIPLNGGGAVVIHDGGITVNNGTMDTFTVDIDGKVTMTSALIQSATGYPKVVMDPDTDLFGAYLDAKNYIQVEANYGGVPSLNFIQGGAFKARMDTLLGYLEIRSLTSLLIQATLDIEIATGASSILKLPPFGRVESSTGQNLGVVLDSKAKAGISTGWSGDHNHGIPPGTVLRTADGGTVTFASAPQHTHAQNS